MEVTVCILVRESRMSWAQVVPDHMGCRHGELTAQWGHQLPLCRQVLSPGVRVGMASHILGLRLMSNYKHRTQTDMRVLC